MIRKFISAVAIVAALISQPAEASMISKATQYVGLNERHNTAKLSKLLGVNPKRTPWCGAFAAAMARLTGVKPPRNPNLSRSWRSFGKPVSIKNARRGDIVVLRGHVTIFTRFTKGKVCGIGGNQRGSVRESCYSTRKVIGVRR